MQNLDPVLLDTSRGRDLAATTRFNATLDAHGCYDRLRFCIRLSPRVHSLIASLPEGIGLRTGVNVEQVQAFSTYLHEKVHWWQHIGSTCGFMLSLSYPAQTHSNLNHLREFLEQAGPVKPIRAWAAANPGTRDLDSPSANANRIVNNQFDIEAYRLLATNPERSRPLIHDPMFENVGHCYNIALSNGIFALASTFDPDFALMPDPCVNEDDFERLSKKHETGFYYGSPVTLPPVGAYQIFEGQARFAQLQYLYFASGGAFDWEDAASTGMLAPMYMAAFEVFLARSELDRPPSINHPIVNLFLLVCDVAMNSGEGFPYPVPYPDLFINDVDPGMRFLYLATAVRLFCPETTRAIIRCDAAEYEHVSTVLCHALKMFKPLEIAAEINRWVQKGVAFRECLTRHDIGQAAPLNLPPQVLCGQFCSFARDKARHPHILCWPGANMAGPNLSENSVGVFSRQSALFIDRTDNEEIVPIIREGVIEADVVRTFNEFYSGHALYDLTRQWITEPVRFKYNYRWLQPSGTPERVKSWADVSFIKAYGVSPDDFELVG